MLLPRTRQRINTSLGACLFILSFKPVKLNLTAPLFRMSTFSDFWFSKLHNLQIQFTNWETISVDSMENPLSKWVTSPSPTKFEDLRVEVLEIDRAYVSQRRFGIYFHALWWYWKVSKPLGVVRKTKHRWEMLVVWIYGGDDFVSDSACAPTVAPPWALSAPLASAEALDMHVTS